MLLTPTEFKTMRVKCGLSYLVVAARFNVSRDTVRKTWEKPGNHVPEAACNWLIDYHDGLVKDAQEKAKWLDSLHWDNGIIVLPTYRDHLNLGKKPTDEKLFLDLRKQYVLNFAESMLEVGPKKYKFKHVWFNHDAYASFLKKRNIDASFNSEILWATSERSIIDPDLRDDFFSSADLYLMRLKLGLSVRDIGEALGIEDGDVMRIELGFSLDAHLIEKAKAFRALVSRSA